MLLTLLFLTSLLLDDNAFTCFPAQHCRTKAASNFPLPLDDFFTHADESTKGLFHRLFMYSLDMLDVTQKTQEARSLGLVIEILECCWLTL